MGTTIDSNASPLVSTPAVKGDPFAQIQRTDMAGTTGRPAPSTGKPLRGNRDGMPAGSKAQPKPLPMPAVFASRTSGGTEKTNGLLGTGLPERVFTPRSATPIRLAFALDVDSTKLGTGVRTISSGAVAQAASPTVSSAPTLSTPQLRELNPLADPADHQRATTWATMFEKTSFTAPLPGTSGAVTTQPISLGAGLSLPAGTKISNEDGFLVNGEPMTQPGREPSLNFVLPSGKTLKLTPDIDKQSGMHMTRVTFEDGRFFRFVGSPFFNAKTGVLTRVQQAENTANAPQYRMRDSFTDASISGWPARNGAISGKEAVAALQGALQ